MTDKDAKSAAEGTAKHYRARANELFAAAPEAKPTECNHITKQIAEMPDGSEVEFCPECGTNRLIHMPFKEAPEVKP